ncbi:MAG: RluA family pseudouridine synthase [Saprospiraceae bacterium]|nr:RluA family pseudouridine synthase [Saprospiraceae bacterium]
MNILFEDHDLMVLDKPAGLSTESGHASHPSAEKLAQELFHQKQPESRRIPYLRAVHRLDRASGGVLVLAKSKQALTELMRQFEQRLVKKTYQALTDHAPKHDSGVLSHWLKRDESGKKALVFDQNMPGTQPCALEYKVLERRDGMALLEIYPETGRFHQIRAQLAHIGCPIYGDVLYGGPLWQEHKIKLQAIRLYFMHPRTNTPVTIEAPWDAWSL